MEDDPIATVNRFNDAINRRDIEAIAALITDDYTFTDSGGHVETGRKNGLNSRRRFFAAFPDYRNVFERTELRGDVVTVQGRSECAEPILNGPALWSARVHNRRVREWRVY